MTKIKLDQLNLGLTKEINIDFLKTRSAMFFKFSIAEFEGGDRRQELNFARQMIMYVAYHCTNENLKTIGRSLGNRDHSTVSHGKDAVQDRLDTNIVYKKKLYEFIHFINLGQEEELEHLITA